MTALILAILSSTAISSLMRIGEDRIRNNMAMFAGNYAICLLMSWLYMPDKSMKLETAGFSFALFIGLFSGIMYLVSFLFLQLNIRINGVVLAATFMRLGVIVPLLMSVLFFGEVPKAVQILGILIACGAILVINSEGEKRDGGQNTKAGLLLLLLILGGLTDSLANIYDKCGNASLKDQYLFFTFFAALMLSAGIGVFRREGMYLTDLLWGAAIGIPNYFSARFLLLALGKISAIIVYPVYNVAVILTVAVIGVFCFRERLSRRKQAGFVLILLSILLLNLNL